MRFSVLQRPPNAPAFGANALVWRTCVRQVALVDDVAVIPEGAAAWHGEAAYAHLLEVICGLHSPIVGETEVLHQFKVFVEALTIDQACWRELCAALLADARAVRSRHLVGLGSRSYGSAVRRHIRDCRRVAIFGTGVLAQEVLPYVIEGGRTSDVWGRRAMCPLPVNGIAYRRLGTGAIESIPDPVALVIAAPMIAREIAAAAAAYANPIVLIDLRAEGATDAPPPIAPIVSLADVFAELQQAARLIDRRVEVAKEEIQRRARALATRAKCNPSGWHDLCA